MNEPTIEIAYHVQHRRPINPVDNSWHGSRPPLGSPKEALKWARIERQANERLRLIREVRVVRVTTEVVDETGEGRG